MEKIIIKPADNPVTSVKSANEIAQEILGEITWTSAFKGYCECPGKASHTNQDGRKDCLVYLDGAPTVYCVHASCAEEVQSKNRQLRFALKDSMPEQNKTVMKEQVARVQREANIRKRATHSKGLILRDHNWPYAQIQKDSPVCLDDVANHWRLLLQKFKPSDVVWIGDKYDSGKPEHAKHFKSVDQWLQLPAVTGPLICPSVFKNNSQARTNDNILTRRFLVVESDVLSKDQVGAVFKWLHQKCGLDLVAIVDTAGKSLHGWFTFPKETEVEELKLVLPALDCDPKLFTPSQPVRLPSALREGKPQKLVYLAKEVGV